MKKVIIIHINGILFHMEDDAYSTMRERIFKQGKQGDKQLEATLAEKFTLLLSASKQVITLADVQQILSELGIKATYESASSQRNSNQSTYNRLYRSNHNKMIGGVCGGFAEYWDMDPVILRLLFVVLFFGFGAGLLLYILMWIVIPIK
jgi:phage shock protein PspC (stress-responsive transcriptional regulator)